MIRVTDMGPVSTVRSQVQTLGTSPQPSAGITQGGTAARNGNAAEAAASASIHRPVAPSAGTARADLHPMDSTPELDPAPGLAVETAKARAEAAQRAYMMAQVAAGLNPLNDPLP